MTPIEIIALIVVIVSTIKIIVLLINPNTWMQKVVKPVYSKPMLLTAISTILAAIVLNYLLAELTIVHIFAVMAFLALIMAVSFASYSKEMLVFSAKMMKDKTVVKKSWLSILIWIILIIWVLYVLFV